MGDQQHGSLRAVEQPTEARGVAAHDLGAVLSPGRSVEGATSDDPLAVDVERPALELAVARVVQLGDDDERDVTPGESQLGGFADPLELGDRTEVDRFLREDPAESASLVASRLGQRARDARVAVDELLRAVLGLPVPRE